MIKKNLVLLIFLALVMFPLVSSEREVGENYTLVSEQFDSCTSRIGTTFKIIYCVDGVPETMHEGATFFLRNFFYWLVTAGLPAIAPTLIILSLVGAALLFAFIPIYLTEEHTPIKLLFIGGALFLCLVIFSYIAQLVTIEYSLIGGAFSRLMDIIISGYKVILWTVVFTVSYFIIYLIWTIVKSFKTK